MSEADTVITVFNPPAPAADKKIKVTFAWYIRDYKVIKISNTTSLKPGMWLTPGVVEKCCQTPNWLVTIVDNSMVENLFSLIGGAKGALGV